MRTRKELSQGLSEGLAKSGSQLGSGLCLTGSPAHFSPPPLLLGWGSGEKGACDLSVPATHLHNSPLDQCLSHSGVQQTTWDLVTSQTLRRSEAGPGIHAPRCCWHCWSEDALIPTLVPEDRILGASRMRWHHGDTEAVPMPWLSDWQNLAH